MAALGVTELVGSIRWVVASEQAVTAVDVWEGCNRVSLEWAVPVELGEGGLRGGVAL